MQQLNEMYEEFKKDRIPLAEFKQFAYECVYTKRHFFGLNQLQEDEFSDFFLYFYPKLDSIIKNFDSNLSQFSTYLFRCIMYLYQAWNNLAIKRESKRNTLNQYAIEEYYEDICSQEPEYCVKDNANKINYKHYIKDTRTLSTKQKIMVIALKSCYYLNGIQIHEICEELEIDEADFTEMITTIKKTLSRKVLINKRHRNTMNTLYIARRQLQEKLNDSDPTNEFIPQLQSKYQSLNNLWNKKINEYNNVYIMPTNKVISEVLHINCYNVKKALNEVPRLLIETGLK